MENRGQADRVTTPAHAELCHARLTTVATETYYYGHQSILKTPQWIVTSKRLHWLITFTLWPWLSIPASYAKQGNRLYQTLPRSLLGQFEYLSRYVHFLLSFVVTCWVTICTPFLRRLFIAIRPMCITWRHPLTRKYIKNGYMVSHNMHYTLYKIGKDWARSSRDMLADIQTDSQTDKHAHHDIPLLPCRDISFLVSEDSGHPPSCIFRNSKFCVLWGLKANLRHHAKFHQNRLERCGDMVFKMAAVRHLGLIIGAYIIGITHEELLVVFTVAQSLAGLDSLISIMGKF